MSRIANLFDIENAEKMHLRWSVHEVLERGESAEHPFGDNLDVAVPQVVHEINVYNVAHGCQKGGRPVRMVVSTGIANSIEYTTCSANG